mmetsp:Transcript_12614/g.27256  ORF Transcript_12614/g.27256 Transcript_12614/m.27256 type:complete len:235 (+) Transcript_12614:1303-2007(+)
MASFGPVVRQRTRIRTNAYYYDSLCSLFSVFHLCSSRSAKSTCAKNRLLLLSHPVGMGISYRWSLFVSYQPCQMQFSSCLGRVFGERPTPTELETAATQLTTFLVKPTCIYMVFLFLAQRSLRRIMPQNQSKPPPNYFAALNVCTMTTADRLLEKPLELLSWHFLLRKKVKLAKRLEHFYLMPKRKLKGRTVQRTFLKGYLVKKPKMSTFLVKKTRTILSDFDVAFSRNSPKVQ